MYNSCYLDVLQSRTDGTTREMGNVSSVLAMNYCFVMLKVTNLNVSLIGVAAYFKTRTTMSCRIERFSVERN